MDGVGGMCWSVIRGEQEGDKKHYQDVAMMSGPKVKFCNKNIHSFPRQISFFNFVKGPFTSERGIRREEKKSIASYNAEDTSEEPPETMLSERYIMKERASYVY